MDRRTRHHRHPDRRPPAAPARRTLRPVRPVPRHPPRRRTDGEPAPADRHRPRMRRIPARRTPRGRLPAPRRRRAVRRRVQPDRSRTRPHPAWAARRRRAAPTAGDRLRPTGLESDRNDQVDILNALARIEARDTGWITGDDTTFTHRGTRAVYAAGDQIVITRTSTDPATPSSPTAPAPSSPPSATTESTSPTGTATASTPSGSPPRRPSPTPVTGTP